MTAPGLLIYCRPGFEKEAASEIASVMLSAGGQGGYVKAKPDAGWVFYSPYDPAEARTPLVGWRDLVFARQLVRDARLVEKLPVNDRARPLAEAAAALDLRFSTVWSETADTNEAKSLSSFCRKFDAPLRQALLAQGLMSNDHTRPRLHLMFLGSAAAYVGFCDTADSAPWPLGIPRLRMPRGAASRSTLKLAEALLLFLDDAERAEWLRPGLSAVDLGAAPGGWTWQLMRHGLHVTAIDNGAMDPVLLASDQVEHIRADGLRWRPKRPVDWLVCDMVEQPARIAGLVADWAAEDLCRQAIFNLKLPMKQRWEALQHCREIIEEKTAGQGRTLRFKQLYHNREEVTGHLGPIVPKRRV